jgi:thiamine biosynthesis protein ThiS
LTKLFLNGQETEVPDGLRVGTLLEWLKLPTDRVAVEHNFVIVPRGEWSETLIEAGDRLEVVHFVGGG